MKNINRVPKKQWLRWSDKAKRVFNETYAFMMDNPDIITHPKQKPILFFHWKTICWNAAWIAADAVMGYRNDIEDNAIVRRKIA